MTVTIEIRRNDGSLIVKNIHDIISPARWETSFHALVENGMELHGYAFAPHSRPHVPVEVLSESDEE